MKFFATEKLGSKRQRTPEGFLLIEGTPIARTGIQKYAPEELDNKIPAGPDGFVHIMRSPEEVFNPVSIASFNGKPFSNEHPNDLIGPDTWRDLALGVIMNPRRGEGEYSDHLVADIMICDAGMIELVEAGKVELSCGYNAEYFQTGIGTGEQRNIIGNHVALVGEGRCGPSCAIGDHGHCNGKQEPPMKKTYRQKLMDMFGTTDKAALDKMLDESPEGAGGVHIHLPGGADEDPMENFGKRMDGMEAGMKTLTDYINSQIEKDKLRDAAATAQAAKDAEEAKKKEEEAKKTTGEDAETSAELAEEAPTGTGDAAKVAKDSTYLADAFQNSVAVAEILVPGFTVPAFDKAAAPKLSLVGICDFRKRVLDAANTTSEGKLILNDILRGRPLDTAKMSCSQARDAFFAAGAAKRAMNNNRTTHTGDNRTTIGESGGKQIKSVADLQRFANEHYKTKAKA